MLTCTGFSNHNVMSFRPMQGKDEFKLKLWQLQQNAKGLKVSTLMSMGRWQLFLACLLKGMRYVHILHTTGRKTIAKAKEIKTQLNKAADAAKASAKAGEVV